MNCVCGHPREAHVIYFWLGRRCYCGCPTYQPEDGTDDMCGQPYAPQQDGDGSADLDCPRDPDYGLHVCTLTNAVHGQYPAPHQCYCGSEWITDERGEEHQQT